MGLRVALQLPPALINNKWIDGARHRGPSAISNQQSSNENPAGPQCDSMIDKRLEIDQEEAAGGEWEGEGGEGG